MQSSQQTSFFDDRTEKGQGPVECLGMTFENDEARRSYYIERLREKLKDPEFRKIEGFPIGEDVDILRLSDPPYFTICPNPFLEDFIHYYQSREIQSTDFTPYAFDISEGKHTWIYKAHTYHTKVPPKAIKAYIEHYTRPGEIVLDGFAGSGMTNVASMMSIPARSSMSCDLSPAASFISSVYTSQLNPKVFLQEAKRIIKQLDDELGWMYEVASPSGKKNIANYYVWSDVYICQSCNKEIIFWDVAFDSKKKEFRDTFKCPHCGVENSKTTSHRAEENVFDTILQKIIKRYKQIPVLVAIPVKGRRQVKRSVNDNDLELLRKAHSANLPAFASKMGVKMMFRDGQWGDQWKSCLHLRPITHVHQFFSLRQLHYISRFMELLDISKPEHRAILFAGTSIMQKCSRLMVYNADEIGRVQKGTLYISSVWQEMRFTHLLSITVDDLIRAVTEGLWTTFPEKADKNTFRVSWAGSATSINLPDSVIDYIFVDPPFGANIPYSEVNFIWESVLQVFTNTLTEAVESGIQSKKLPDYQSLMFKCFSEFYRVLKPGRWITIEFHNSKNTVWNAIQQALTAAGFTVADVRTLDKKQKAFKQATAAGAVKQDLIIAAYKPNGNLVERTLLTAGTENSAWEFVHYHLGKVPVVNKVNGNLMVNQERQPFLLFDRMVAFHVQRGILVPLSAAEFYAGLSQRFPERDGMYFLPNQVSEYDQERLQAHQVQQLQLFVSDESSAILWLRQNLETRPQTYSELFPKFIREISAWQKFEKSLELSEILEQNFLSYDGSGIIPNQIWSWIQRDEETREVVNGQSRENASNAVRTLAKGRWFVPDPNNAQQLEKVREGHLLKEFDGYKLFPGKKLKVFRLEAVRTGFKKAWQDRDYKTIIAVAEKISEDALQEDPKLLMWYDQAVTRMEQ